jgi:hypothetical protein
VSQTFGIERHIERVVEGVKGIKVKQKVIWIVLFYPSDGPSEIVRPCDPHRIAHENVPVVGIVKGIFPHKSRKTWHCSIHAHA